MRDGLLWLALATILLGSGCSDAKSERGLRYFPDMYHSAAQKSQEAWVREVRGPDGRVMEVQHIPAMLTPPDDTVPRHFMPYVLGDELADLELAQKNPNPLAPTREVLRRGRERFETFCAVCHGRDGDWEKAYVAQQVVGLLSVNSANVAEMPDGQIFHIITRGRGRMPSYAAQLLPEDRWAVIHYVRVLGDLAAAKPEEKRRLERLQREEGAAFRPDPEPVPEYERRVWPSLPQEVSP